MAAMSVHTAPILQGNERDLDGAGDRLQNSDRGEPGGRWAGAGGAPGGRWAGAGGGAQFTTPQISWVNGDVVPSLNTARIL